MTGSPRLCPSIRNNIRYRYIVDILKSIKYFHVIASANIFNAITNALTEVCFYILADKKTILFIPTRIAS